jgi:hypothetical protein
MKLPDYSSCSEIYQLHIAMGISNIPHLEPIKFEREIVKKFEKNYIDNDDVNLSKQIKKEAIVVRKTDVSKYPGSLLEYKGRKVAVYIRDQKASVDFHHKTSSYKYHLCNCMTLQKMRSYGREYRYLATQRRDGFFEVHDLTGTKVRKGEARLGLCKNCIELLNEKNLYFSPFSIEEYFKNNDSYTPKTIKRIETVREIQTYSPKQEDYSREYRKACKYRCQVCHVDLSEHKNLLHLHHIDGNPANNQRHNLHVLCVDCHSKQPLHGHMQRNPSFKKAISLIHELRLKQGLVSVGPFNL